MKKYSVEIEYFLLDDTRDLEPIGKTTYFGARLIAELTLPNLASCLLKIKKL